MNRFWLVSDTRPIVEPLAALAGGPCAVFVDAPTAAATDGQAAIVVQANVEDQHVAVEWLGNVGIGADRFGPGTEGANFGNGRRLVR